MRYFYALAIMLLASHAISFSQTVLIRGKVKTDTDSALAGAVVRIKDTAIATTTNKNGEFTIAVPKFPAILVFSSVGCKTKEFRLKKTDSTKYITINLYSAEATMDEVVVVGYGTAKRSVMTGSVVVSHSDKSFSSPLAGMCPGLSVAKADKADKAVRSRDKGMRDEVKGATENHKPYHSKILTAGELSDFKKWNLWEGYSNAEFRQWSAHWGITPINRYCVQVQNENHTGIAGEKVYLINRYTRDTAWRAVTDNTGKAELWANCIAADSNQNTYAIVSGNQTNRFPTTFENGINRITLKKACAYSNMADIAFVVDATGSMGDEIRYLQEELQDVIANTAAKNKGINFRIGSVFYRDHTDQYLTRSIDFQNDPAPLIRFIQEQSAKGGGDYPEAVDDALTVALDSLHWDAGAGAKIIFLILDAPPHDAAKDKMKNLIIRAAAMGVRIVPVVCSGVDKSTEYLMRSLALTTNGSYIFLTDDSGVGGEHIKPTTDNYKVELLNDLLQRVIAEMIFMAPCDDKEKPAAPVLPDNIAKVIVYPNPSSGRIRIRSTEKIKELFLTDFTGKMLEKINTGDKKQHWQTDLSNYPSGTYLIRYFTEQKGWGAEKVLLIK
jgi:hypothetical protein